MRPYESHISLHVIVVGERSAAAGRVGGHEADAVVRGVPRLREVCGVDLVRVGQLLMIDNEEKTSYIVNYDVANTYM